MDKFKIFENRKTRLPAEICHRKSVSCFQNLVETVCGVRGNEDRWEESAVRIKMEGSGSCKCAQGLSVCYIVQFNRLQALLLMEKEGFQESRIMAMLFLSLRN